MIGRLNYIGLKTCDVVQCPECGFISFDEIPDSATTVRGCEINYCLKNISDNKKRVLKGHKRGYRRGGYFARNYMPKLFQPGQALNILEIGAGIGYFSQGIKYHYPDSNIHYVDIVEELVSFYKDFFDCEAEAGEFSESMFAGKKFDLIIARDLIEHLRDPLTFFKDVNKKLKDGGYFFFITPNGRENIWEVNQRYLKTGEESLILQNHYHYYLPESLDGFLRESGFEKAIAFKYGLKYHRRGFGHKEMESFTSYELPDTSLKFDKDISTDYLQHDKNEVLNSICSGNGFISRLYSSITDSPKQICDYYDFKGHVFFVIAKKI